MGRVMTDLWDGAIIDTRIWHARSGDVARQFRYRARYLALPVAELDADKLPLKLDRRGIWSLRRRDYGYRDGSALSGFIQKVLEEVGMAGCAVTLVTLPRSSGYGFNPVSFWLARDGQGLRAVLAEVSNTFGERHLYLCRYADNRVITSSDRMKAEKLFHVSPFLPRAGHYVFRFDARPGRFGAWIDWIGPRGEVKLQTAMTGPANPLTRASLRRAALLHPLQSQRVITLIHMQAARLFARGVKYRDKPEQLATIRSQTGGSPDVRTPDP